MRAIKVGIIGYGKIAKDQHVPAMARIPRYELAAVVTRSGGGPDGVRCFADYKDMLAEVPEIDAVAICTPASVRYEITRACLEAGKHVLIEKPPGMTIGEVEALAGIAEERDLSFFTTWHAQENDAVAAAADLLAGQAVSELAITWHEDVRKWHPGQQWIWEAGGFGVFDPGINALSIATRIMPDHLLVRSADLFYPSNKQMPIAAELTMVGASGRGPFTLSADWRHSGGEEWTMDIRTEGGLRARLLDGGARLEVNGVLFAAGGEGEYPTIYRRFLDLIDERACHVDIGPLRLVADAFLLGTRHIIEPFED